ncbi:acid phosphatase pho5 [Ascosphaera atra]|nr:acid phosphatase pho5 [Ascosphaera atra]
MKSQTLLSALSLVGASYASEWYSTQSVLAGNKQFIQQSLDDFNVLKHTGGCGPYVDRRSMGISRNPPEQCTVDQVVMLMRHGERYPTPDDAGPFKAVLEKVRNAAGKDGFTGALSFMNEWEYFVPNDCSVEAETDSGPYAGVLNAYTRGNDYRARYGHLLDPNKVTPFWSSGYQRVITTARHFGMGFFGYNYSTSAALNIISEDESQGVNSLTPTCYNASDDEAPWSEGEQLPLFKFTAERLNKLLPNGKLNATDVFNLISIASFELNARPYSPWVGVFTPDEWVAYGYIYGVNFHDQYGPGNAAAKAGGSVFLNATLRALNEGPQKNSPLLFNFAHDTNLLPLITALDIVTPDHDKLPRDRVVFDSKWQFGEIISMGGRMVFERLNCSETPMNDEGLYVRMVLNEGVIPLNECQGGPGYSCPLTNFIEIYQKKMPNFAEQCGLPKKYPQTFDMWWNYNTSTDLNYMKKPILCAQAEAME